MLLTFSNKIPTGYIKWNEIFKNSNVLADHNVHAVWGVGPDS